MVPFASLDSRPEVPGGEALTLSMLLASAVRAQMLFETPLPGTKTLLLLRGYDLKVMLVIFSGSIITRHSREPV